VCFSVSFDFFDENFISSCFSFTVTKSTRISRNTPGRLY
jgi:hypothetical protein